MSKGNSLKCVATVEASSKGIDAKTGAEKVFTGKATVHGQNPVARAKKAAKAMIDNQKPWMLLGTIKFTIMS